MINKLDPRNYEPLVVKLVMATLVLNIAIYGISLLVNIPEKNNNNTNRKIECTNL